MMAEFQLPAYLAKQFPALASNWDEVKRNFTPESIPAHTVLVREGELATQVFIIVRGGIRLWHNEQDREVTVRFFFENQPVTAFESFYLGEPSQFVIETTEDSELLVLTKRNFDALSKQYPSVYDQMMRLAIKRFYDYRDQVYESLHTSPTQRYQHVLANEPELMARVPLNQLASYLGITPISLSRIRRKLNR